MNEQPPVDPNESTSHNNDGLLKPKELHAAALLARGMKQGEVARILGVVRTTIHRYQQKPGFSQAVETARVAFFDGLVDRSWSIMERALDVIDESLAEKDTQTALGYFRTMAPGLRDVRRIEEPEPPRSIDPSIPVPEPTNFRIAEAASSGTQDRWCSTCRREMKSPRGLAQHNRMKHPSGGDI